jgi:aspartate/methionine/tyrosine aminotransferase
VRLDGATKEFFAWGFRVGFITFGVEDASTKDFVNAVNKD